MKTYITGALAVSLLALSAPLALAQDATTSYATRPVTFIMPFGAGGSGDTIARLIASQLETRIGQPVNVVNRTGGGGVVGHTAIAQADPDGYTIGLAPLELITANLQGLTTLHYDEFTPFGYVASISAGLTVNSASDYETAEDLIEAIRSSEKGELVASGTAYGGAYHIALGVLLQALDLPVDHVRWVPAEGAAPAYQDLAAGGLDFNTAALTEARALIELGDIRPLAILANERSDVYADLPTVEEIIGAPVEGGTWFTIVGPKGVPDEIRDELAGHLEDIVATPEFAELSERLGLTPQFRGPAETVEFWQSTEEQIAPLLEQLNIGG